MTFFNLYSSKNVVAPHGSNVKACLIIQPPPTDLNKRSHILRFNDRKSCQKLYGILQNDTFSQIEWTGQLLNRIQIRIRSFPQPYRLCLFD